MHIRRKCSQLKTKMASMRPEILVFLHLLKCCLVSYQIKKEILYGQNNFSIKLGLIDTNFISYDKNNFCPKHQFS